MAEPFAIQLVDNADDQAITFSGNLVINHIDKIASKVKEITNTKKSLEIIVDKCEGIDITFIQLIIALQKTWMQNGLEFSVQARIKEEHTRLIENAGFINILK